MPLHNVGYRAWQGTSVPPATRLITIASTGVRRAFHSRWLRRLLFLALLPILFFSIAFFLFEQAQRDPAIWRAFRELVGGLPNASILQQSLGSSSAPSAEQFAEMRPAIWSYLLLTLLRYPQAILMLLVVGIVAPPLISQDLRTRAYLIYFSRPITRTEYIFGKLCTVAFFVSMISALPALLLYGLAVMLSPSLDVVLTTWDLPLRILLASVVLIVPTALVALAFSALTLESRSAAFAWFAMWIVGHVTYSVLVAFQTMDLRRGSRDIAIEQLGLGWRMLTSPYQVLGTAQAFVFGFVQDTSSVIGAFVLLGLASAASLWILYRRVNAPMSQ